MRTFFTYSKKTDLCRWLKSVLIFELICCIFLFISDNPAWAKSQKETHASTITVYIGQSKRIALPGIPQNAIVHWKSSKSNIVSVKKGGIIHGKKTGTATVTASYEGRKFLFRVKVKKYIVRLAVVDTAGSDEPFKILRAFPSGAGCKLSVVTNVKALDLKRFDGLILPGGGDINPKRYNRKNHGSMNINNSSDSIQIKAFRRFREAGKPILGICKGAQLINVCMGGTLYQNIGYSHYYRSWRHIKVSKKSVFKNCIPGRNVPCYHHQAIKKIGKGLRVTMKDSRDGGIEGIEGTDEPIYGLQWHPDMMGFDGWPVLTKFVKICRKNHKFR